MTASIGPDKGYQTTPLVGDPHLIPVPSTQQKTPLPASAGTPPNTRCARGGRNKRVRSVSSPLSEANLGEVARSKAETEGADPSMVPDPSTKYGVLGTPQIRFGFVDTHSSPPPGTGVPSSHIEFAIPNARAIAR